MQSNKNPRRHRFPLLHSPWSDVVKFTLVIAALALGPLRGLSVLVLAVLAAVILAALARWQIGGTTGDVLGATQQTAETVILLALAASFSTEMAVHQ